MKLSSLLTVVLLGTLVVTGCGRIESPPVTSPDPRSGNPVEERAQPPDPAPQPDEAAAEPRHVDLREVLLQTPAPKAAPAFQVAPPPQGYSFSMLSSGTMLVWTSRYVEHPHPVMTLSARNRHGKIVWTWEGNGPPRAFRYIEVSASGDRLAVVTEDGTVHVLNVHDGREVTKLTLTSDQDWGVGFADKGKYLSFRRRTPSGFFRYVIELHELVPGARRAHGTSGFEVHSSPYHDLALGLGEKGFEIKDSSGVLGTIPHRVDGGRIKLETSADGNLILILTSSRGLEAFGRDGRPLWQMPDLAGEVYWWFAPVARVLWVWRASDLVELLDAGSRVMLRLSLPPEARPWRAMPGGELVLRVKTGDQTSYCVVTPAGQLFGCAQFITWEPEGARETGSFFWSADDNLIRAYRR
jgi:hypothetical protein